MSKLQQLTENYGWVNEIANKTIIELKKTHDVLVEAHSVFFDKFNISDTKFNVLVILYNNNTDEGLMLSEIGDQMLVTKGNITGLIDRLEKQGHVKRIRDGIDRRKIMAVITEQGRGFTQKVIEEYKEWSKNIMTILNDEEKSQLIGIFYKIQKGLIEL